MATVTALTYTVYRIGSAVGSAISGCIWTQKLYPEILKRLGGNVSMATAAYASPYTFITTYTWGTSEREAVVEAYKYVQKLETVVALVFCAPLLMFSLCLRDAKLTDKVAHDGEIPEGEYTTKDEDPIADWFKACVGKFKKSKEVN